MRLLFTILLALTFLGCMGAPSKGSFKDLPGECFMFAQCLYGNKSNPDKSICTPIAEACRDAFKESRVLFRVNYCRDRLPNGMTEAECRLYLGRM